MTLTCSKIIFSIMCILVLVFAGGCSVLSTDNSSSTPWDHPAKYETPPAFWGPLNDSHPDKIVAYP